MRAVRFDNYGSVDVLHVVDAEAPTPGQDQVVVGVVATSINPGEIMIREGPLAEQAPATFPSGQGSDLAGRVAAVGPGVTGWSMGDEVLGWTDDRAAQAELVAVPADQLTARPAGVPWEQAGSLYVAGRTAYGMVDAVSAHAGRRSWWPGPPAASVRSRSSCCAAAALEYWVSLGNGTTTGSPR